MTSLNQLLQDVVNKGGAIISSDKCTAIEIAMAQAGHRFAIDENGMGFVRKSSNWLEMALEGYQIVAMDRLAKAALGSGTKSVAASTDHERQENLWKREIELQRRIGFLIGALEGIQVQVSAELQTRIESVLIEARKPISDPDFASAPHDCLQEKIVEIKKWAGRMGYHNIKNLCIDALELLKNYSTGCVHPDTEEKDQDL